MPPDMPFTYFGSLDALISIIVRNAPTLVAPFLLIFGSFSNVRQQIVAAGLDI